MAMGELESRIPRRAALTLFVLAIAVLAVLLMPLPKPTRMQTAMWDLCHAPLFVAVCIMTIRVVERAVGRCGTKRLLAVTVAVAIAGLATEFLQRFARRTPSLSDATANLLGAVAGAGLVLAIRTRGIRRVSCVTVSVAALVAASFSSVRTIVDSVAQNRQFPLLASFESNVELSRWFFRKCHYGLSREGVTDGETSLKLVLLPKKYPGAGLIWVPADWSEYRTLELDVTWNPEFESSVPLTLALKVTDEAHAGNSRDRFGRRLVLRCGTNHIVVRLSDVRAAPVDRELNLSRIDFVQLFGVDLTGEQTIYVDNLRLRR